MSHPDKDPEDDRLLRECLERHPGKVILASKYVEREQGGEGRSQDKVIGLDEPNETLMGPADGQRPLAGMINFWQADGVVRTLALAVTPSQADLLSGKGRVVINPEDRPVPHVSKLMAPILEPAALEGVPNFVNLRFCPPEAYPWISLHEVFVEAFWESNHASGGRFKDKVVMVGAVAPDLQDFQRTPFGDPAGVQLHAHALTALLAGEFLKDAPDWWRWAALGAGFVLAWVLMTLVRQPLLGLAGLVGLSVLAYMGGQWAFDGWNVELPPLPFVLALNLCGLTGLSGNYFLKLRETRKLQRFLARYTSPELVREMMQDRAGLYTTLKGSKRNVTVLFSDVRDFTSMSEEMDPEEMVTQLNEYLSRMVAAVVSHRGLVDKFIGDAVMALWGSTRAQQGEEGDRQDAINAVNAALVMRTALAELNAGWAERQLVPFKFGIGIHQGPVIAGNIGSDAPHEKMDLTVIGDNVNLASRLEGLTKAYGTDLVISEAVRSQVGGRFVVRAADLVRPKGKLKPVEVFSVLGPEGMPLPPGLDAYEKGVRIYREGRFIEALACFNEAADAGLDDTLTREYRSRCEALIQTPPETWDGVYTMTKK
jgi:adenylate cyclase